MPYFAHLGTKEQKDYYMPKLVSGEMVSAIGMTEPGIESEFELWIKWKFCASNHCVKTALFV